MHWKQAIYQSYVSSGHVAERENLQAQLRGRVPFLRSLIRRLFPHDKNARILDVGCGHGALVHVLRECGYRNVVGIDGSPEQVDLAGRLGIEGVQFGEAFPYLQALPAGSFDVLCFFDVLEHLDRQELYDWLVQASRVLSPAGCCIGHVPNASGLFSMGIRYGDLTHELAFTESSLRQIFRTLGFTQVRCCEDRPVVHGITSLTRRVLWEAGSLPFRILYAAETSRLHAILSQNLSFIAMKRLPGPSLLGNR
ncbi:MAG TPA: class I SAM-dependent methyltransferase [Acidobacteriaceae bacterium]